MLKGSVRSFETEIIMVRHIFLGKRGQVTNNRMEHYTMRHLQAHFSALSMVCATDAVVKLTDNTAVHTTR